MSKKKDPRASALRQAEAQVMDGINTWADAYTYMDTLMQRTVAGGPMEGVDAMLTMYSFIRAMRELPEEGDIKVLFRESLRQLVYEVPAALNIVVEFRTEEEHNAPEYVGKPHLTLVKNTTVT